MPEDEHRQLRLDLKRRPLLPRVALDDVDGMREGALRAADDAVSLLGRLPGELMFVSDGFMDVAGTEGIAAVGEEGIVAAVLRGYGQPGEPARRFRRGEVVVERQRHAAVLELIPGTPDRWWRALRRIGTGNAGVGVFHGEWERAEGEGLEALDEALREWIDLDKVEVTESRRELGPPPSGPVIDMGIALTNGEPPAHPCEVAQFLGGMNDGDLLAGRLKGIVVCALRPGVIERYEVRGRLDCTPEDLVRAIAAQGEPPLAMALMHPAVVDLPNGERRRCFVTMVERNGRMGHRLLPVEAADGELRALQPLLRDAGPVPEGGAWIGVPPSVPVDFTAIGLPDAPGGIGEA